MKVIILKENLNTGIAIVGKAVGKNLTLPILSNILISAKNNILSLSATDLEIGIKYRVLAKTEKKGKAVVPFKILSNLINLLPSDKIFLESKNQTLYVSSKNYKSQIKGLAPEEFPIIPKTENKSFLELNCASFCQGLSQVVDFSVLNQTRPELSGVYLNFQKNKLRMAATDSFRLAEKNISFEKENDKEVSFILPQKTAREIVNIFSEKKAKLDYIILLTKFYLSIPQKRFLILKLK